MARLCRALTWGFFVGIGLANVAACTGKKRDFGEAMDAPYAAPGSMSNDDDRESDEPALSDPTGAAASDGTGAEPSSTPGEVMIGPRLAVAPASLELGAIVVDLAAVRSATVSNTGDQVLPVPTVALVGGSAPEFSVLQNGCQDPLEPGDGCLINVQFLALVPGAFTGALLVDAAEIGSMRVALTAAGLPLGDLLLAPVEGSSAQFGSVRLDDSSEATFRLLNPGTVPSGPLAIAINNPDFALLSPVAGDCIPGVTDLPPGASCTLHVAFTPSRREPAEAILTVDAATGSVGLRLDGIGSAPAALSPSQDELVVRAVFGQSARATVVVENQGDESVSLVAARIDTAAGDAAATDAEYTVVESTCAGLLEGRASCQLVIEFRPGALGLRPATLWVTPEAGEPLSIPIAGEGLKPGALVVAPVDSVSPAAGAVVDFGAVLRSDERIVTFRITNPGAESSGFLEQLAASGDFSVVAPAPGECATTTVLVNGEACDLRVRFRPALRGPRDGSLTVVSVGVGSVAVPLHGTGIVPADLSATPATVEFGSAVLNQTRTATVTVTNDGDETASAPQTQISGNGAEAFTVTGCGSPIDALASCALTVTFHPTLNPGHAALLTPTLLITSAAGGTANVAMTARGLRPGSLDISLAAGSSPAFQAIVNGSQTQTFNIANTGGVDSGALTFSVNNPAGRRNFELLASGQATACRTGQSLGAGSSCSVGVAFSPIAAGTNFSATLSVTSSAAGTDSIGLTGVAQALATLTGNVASTSFPNPGAAEFPWVLTNNGDVATPPMSLGTVPTGFSLGTAGNCPFNQAAGLPAHSSCTVFVRFSSTQAPSPGQDQSIRGTLVVSAGNLPAVSLALTGIIPRALAAGGQVCAGDASCQTGLVCGETGGGDLNVCCNSRCDDPCRGCTTGAGGGICSPRGADAVCTTSGTSREGLCSQQSACIEYCILNQSTPGCLLR